MDLEGRLTEEQQDGIATAFENAYARSTDWSELRNRYGKFAPLHHPYIDSASNQGSILFTSLIRPPALMPKILQDCDTYREVILTPGGSVVFDSEYGQNSLGIIKEQAPDEVKQSLSAVSAPVLEKRVFQYVRGVMRMLEELLKQPATDETLGRSGYDVRNGLFDLDLLDLAAYLQTYIIAKIKGLEAVRPLIPLIQAGELVYNG